MFAGYGKRLIYHLHAAGQLGILQLRYFDCCCFGCVTRSPETVRKNTQMNDPVVSCVFSQKQVTQQVGTPSRLVQAHITIHQE